MFSVIIFGIVLVHNTIANPVNDGPETPVLSIPEITPKNRAAPVPSCTSKDTPQQSKNGVINKNLRWTNFNVHPDQAYNQDELNTINNAMYNLMQILPCVKFGIWPQNSTPSGDYVRIIKGTNNGCNSYVGRLGGKQDMNLQSPGCSTNVGATMHEMIHALGLYHEQSRPDRDDYVNILWDNIIPEYKFAFDKYNTSYVSTFGVAYNTRSIMHYNTYDFTKNGQKTITAKNGGAVGSTGELQETDKQKLKKMYNC